MLALAVAGDAMALSTEEDFWKNEACIRKDQVLIRVAESQSAERALSVARRAIPGSVGGVMRGALILASLPDHQSFAGASIHGDLTGGLTVGDAGLLRALGAEEAIGPLTRGSVVWLGRRPKTGTVEVTAAGYPVDGGPIKLPVFSRAVHRDDSAWHNPLPYHVVSEATALRAGLRVYPSATILLRAPHPFSKGDLDRLRDSLATNASAVQTAKDLLHNHFGPGPGAESINPVRFGVAAVGGWIAFLFVVALALRISLEAHKDVALEHGLGPLRSSTAAASASLVGAWAGLISFPAGFVPVAIGQSVRNNPYPVVVPWGFAAIVMVAMPIAMAALAAALCWRPARGTRLQPTA